MSSSESSVLVLGAYGQVGRRLAPALAKQGHRVIAAGRDSARLSSVAASAGSHAHRIEPLPLDVTDEGALRRAAGRASVVVNCIGPFVTLGPPAARAAVEAGAHYLDIASEQAHYRALEALAPLARDRSVAMIPGAGLYPGLSGLLLTAMRPLAPDATRARAAMAAGTTESRDAGAASLMTGILELCFPLEHRDGGRLVPIPPTETIEWEFPHYGTLEALRWPSLEVLSLGDRLGLEGFDTYAFLGGAPAPKPLEVRLVRLLAPHRRRWAYNLARRYARAEVAKLFDAGREKGWDTSVVVTALLEGGAAELRRDLIARDMVGATCALPLRLTDALTRQPAREGGLLTPSDILDPLRTLQSLIGDSDGRLRVDGGPLEPAVEDAAGNTGATVP